MKVAWRVLFSTLVLFLVLANSSSAYAASSMTKDALRKEIKKFVHLGYATGTIVKFERDCGRVMSLLKRDYEKNVGRWNEVFDPFIGITIRSCEQGYRDKLSGEYNLPAIYRLVDIATDSP